MKITIPLALAIGLCALAAADRRAVAPPTPAAKASILVLQPPAPVTNHIVTRVTNPLVLLTNQPSAAGRKASFRDHELFETAFRMGYDCALKGGHSNDVQVLMNAHRFNRMEVLKKWFEDHK